MAQNIQERDGRFQLRIKHKLLERPYFSTFESEQAAITYRDTLKSYLRRGMVPQGLQPDAPAVKDPLVVEVIRSYEKLGPVTPFDAEMLSATMGEFLGVRVSSLTAEWVDAFVKKLKMVANNSPGTIRKKVGVYGRILDWHIRRTTAHGAHKQTNPFRGLPNGYSTYTADEAEALRKESERLATDPSSTEKPKKAKRDQSRERRFGPGEGDRIDMALRGERLPGAKWVRPPHPDLQMLYELIVDSGVRLREGYTVKVEYLQLDRGFTRVDGTKGRGGVAKPRIVPLKPALIAKLRPYVEGKTGLLFPFWDGTEKGKKLATRALVQAFRRLFAHARVPDFKEHDLRHEACCRWFELRGKDGHWLYSDVEICKIMGWSDYSMVLRYASIRGEDLAARMAA
ncbi:tyrosine-type recombinase/integrase [Variovorax sp. EBFNA2]|uniref:tyrosine-type recombinase/integrase n=1 Tax=Variovorax sp. EBFNA2 TaxID=3342097 RepID=UPI0029C027FB|nr:tyrosine-type recombinase/integrase [Variovorax boronicumulans]WPG35284.1 tyrosine-type recombinase/integrase [Variovorax boronicumulans]